MMSPPGASTNESSETSAPDHDQRFNAMRKLQRMKTQYQLLQKLHAEWSSSDSDSDAVGEGEDENEGIGGLKGPTTGGHKESKAAARRASKWSTLKEVVNPFQAAGRSSFAVAAKVRVCVYFLALPTSPPHLLLTPFSGGHRSVQDQL